MAGPLSSTCPAALVGRAGRALVLATLALCVGAVVGAGPSAATGSAAREPTLVRAALIRAESNARYRRVTGRRLAVVEASTTSVVPHFTLLDLAAESSRLVATGGGVYFAICTAPARCPFRVGGSSWTPGAFLPRRQALELALRTFAETPAELVVVSLPTSEPLWVVFERDDVLALVDTAALGVALEGRPRVAAPRLRTLVFGLTRSRLYAPIPILPPPRDTIYAFRTGGP